MSYDGQPTWHEDIAQQECSDGRRHSIGSHGSNCGTAGTWYPLYPPRRRGKHLRVKKILEKKTSRCRTQKPHASATLRPLRTTKRLGK
jgi:hypothetical protein